MNSYEEYRKKVERYVDLCDNIGGIDKSLYTKYDVKEDLEIQMDEVF